MGEVGDNLVPRFSLFFLVVEKETLVKLVWSGHVSARCWQMTDKWSKEGVDKFESLLAKEAVPRQNDLRKMSNPQGKKTF